MTLFMTIEPIHLLPEVKCNSCIIVYLKFSSGNYSIAGKRGHWPASKDVSLPYCILPLFSVLQTTRHWMTSRLIIDCRRYD